MLNTYNRVAPTLALVLAVVGLCMGGAVASGTLKVTTKEIRNGAVTAKDLHKNAVTSRVVRNGSVRAPDVASGAVTSSAIAPDAVQTAAIAPSAVQSTEIANGAVESQDIGAGQVTPQDAGFPEPEQQVEPAQDVAVAEVGSTPALVDDVGAYVKESAETDLSVTWTGTAGAGFSPCVFQLRVDGQPSGPEAGQVYVPNGSVQSVSATATFSGLEAGPHEVQVFARTTTGASYPCTVGPAQAGIGQTFTYEELVH